MYHSKAKYLSLWPDQREEFLCEDIDMKFILESLSELVSKFPHPPSETNVPPIILTNHYIVYSILNSTERHMDLHAKFHTTGFAH